MTGTTLEPLTSEVRVLVAEIAELHPDQIEPDTPFAEADIDSLLAMEIAVHVESRFDVRFEDAEVKQVQTVRQLAELVARERARQP
ncbi:acyl carrier protein [Nocardioides caldifontis]|uniref:acyl carrier protein n=1 Tax=Nocardioides caldifontis TaxID=2588938 RepID=UPI0011DFBFCA|nr:acyl carrier protein [Nocardioides caldifontis]